MFSGFCNTESTSLINYLKWRHELRILCDRRHVVLHMIVLFCGLDIFDTDFPLVLICQMYARCME